MGNDPGVERPMSGLTVGEVWAWQDRERRAPSESPKSRPALGVASPRRSGFMTAEEVAAYLDVHPQTVRELARKDRIPAIKIGGRTAPYRFRRTSIDAWLDKLEKGGHR